MERRACQRLPLACPVVFDIDGNTLDGKTQNLSSGGFYCICGRPFAIGDRLHCWIAVIPAGRGSGQDGVLECLVRVVRIDDLSEGFFGIACHIEEYIVFGSQ
jgi:hypothetical protein